MRPSGNCSAHSTWSRSFDVSLSIEDHSRPRRSLNSEAELSADGGAACDLNGGKLRRPPHAGKSGVKPVLDHGRVRGGHQVEVQRLTGMHDLSAPERKGSLSFAADAPSERRPPKPGGMTFTVRYTLRLTTVLSMYAVPVIFRVATPSGVPLLAGGDGHAAAAADARRARAGRSTASATKLRARSVKSALRAR